MFLLKRTLDKKPLFMLFRCYNRQSHYDTLKLPKSCTDKQIKEAFIKLSKEYHPDKNKHAKAQEEFVKIVEAYNVLSKPSSRAEYDNSTYINYGDNSYVYKTHVPYNLRKNPNHGFYNEAQQSSQNSNSYYGISGIKKVPNIAIIAICFGIAVFGVILQYTVIRKSYHVHRQQMIEKSQRLSDELAKVKASANGRTNEMQTQMLLDKIVSAANHSAATASLGQALSSEKKNDSHYLYTQFDEENSEDDSGVSTRTAAYTLKSYHIHRQQMIEKPQILSDELDKVEASANGRTNEIQTQILLDKIVSAANHSAATASLGQALSSEKK